MGRHLLQHLQRPARALQPVVPFGVTGRAIAARSRGGGAKGEAHFAGHGGAMGGKEADEGGEALACKVGDGRVWRSKRASKRGKSINNHHDCFARVHGIAHCLGRLHCGALHQSYTHTNIVMVIE